MTSPRPPARLRHDRRGVTSIEFAIAAAVMLTLCLGILDVGLLQWLRSGLQVAAARTARCVALGATACSGGAQAYAVSLAQQWLFPGVVATGNVTITTATACGAGAGQYVKVVINAPSFGSGLLPPPLAASGVTATACYPSGL
jgi:Flp pilus assembly protein TadG